MLNIAIVGTGAVAHSLAKNLSVAGCKLLAIVSRSRLKAETLASKVGALHGIQLGTSLPLGVQLVFICVPDDAIAPTASQLAHDTTNWEGIMVAHTSGALSVDVLQDLVEVGASILSFHPVQTFSKDVVTSFSGIYIGIEGHSKALEKAEQLAELLGSIPLRLSSQDKVLYHAAAVFASNFLVSVTSMACDLLSEVGMNRSNALKMLSPLIQQTCENILSVGPEQALTGPAARGDLETLQKHSSALNLHNAQYYALYRQLSEQAVHLAVKADRLSELQADKVLKELGRPGNE